MMILCLVDPVGAEMANQSNSGLQHSSTLGAWVCRAGWGAGGRVKSRFVSSEHFLSLRDPVCFCCSCSDMNHTAPQGSILGTDFPVGDINGEACEGLLKGILEAFFCPPTDRLPYKSCFGRRSSSIRVTWPDHII